MLRSILVVAAITSAGSARGDSSLGMAPSGAQTLVWRAPASCPDAASLKHRVENRLERSLDDVDVGVEVDVSLAAGRYTATIDLRAVTVANDVRTLTSRRCGELADAVAVIVARVASDAIAARQVAARQVVVATRDEDEPVASTRVVAPPRVIAAPPPRPWTIGARISGVSGIGIIPKVGLGGELALTLRRHDLLGELAGTRWVTSAAQFHDGAPTKLDVDLDVAAARVGWRPTRMPLRAWVSVEVGNMRGGGVALPSEQLDGGRWIAAGAGFGIAWQMRPWIRLVGGTETMLAVERVRFSMGDGIVVYAPSPMSVRTTCGVEVGWQ